MGVQISTLEMAYLKVDELKRHRPEGSCCLPDAPLDLICIRAIRVFAERGG